jgi:hypothetical protein
MVKLLFSIEVLVELSPADEKNVAVAAPCD